MDYQNTLKYLYESVPMFQQIGSKAYKPGLETTHKLDEHFGHPHQQFKTILPVNLFIFRTVNSTIMCVVGDLRLQISTFKSKKSWELRKILC